jgi:hypothetical protein
MPTRIEFDPADVEIDTLTLAEHPHEVRRIMELFEEASREMAWQPGDQITAYPRSSIYFALRIDGRIEGAVQLVRGGSEEGLPVLTVWPELRLQGRQDVADVALVVLHKALRGRRHFYWALYAAMWRHCVRAGITELWMEVPHEKLASYRGLGWPLSVEGPLRPHWEEPCFPCRVSVRGVGEAMIARARRGGTYFRTVEDEYRELAGQST